MHRCAASTSLHRGSAVRFEFSSISQLTRAAGAAVVPAIFHSAAAAHRMHAGSTPVVRDWRHQTSIPPAPSRSCSENVDAAQRYRTSSLYDTCHCWKQTSFRFARSGPVSAPTQARRDPERHDLSTLARAFWYRRRMPAIHVAWPGVALAAASIRAIAHSRAVGYGDASRIARQCFFWPMVFDRRWHRCIYQATNNSAFHHCCNQDERHCNRPLPARSRQRAQCMSRDGKTAW